MIRVVIADDHAVVRGGLARIVRDTVGMQVVAEASSVPEVLDAVRSTECDVLLLDVNFQGQTSLDAMKTIRIELPSVRILVLSMYPEEHYAIRFLKAGASGYLTKDAAPDELIVAISRVASGKRYLTAELAEAALLGAVDGERPPHNDLSDREYEVMIGIASGRRIRDIAESLNLSDKTISTYRARILRKLGCESTADIVAYALGHDLLSDV